MYKSFTLIELLIVIAIIGILAGILFVSIGLGPLQKARDEKRLKDMKAIELALQLYNIHYGNYPSSVDSNSSEDPGVDHSGIGDGFIKGLYDNTRGDNPDNIAFISSDPIDPINVGTDCYCCGTENDLSYVYYTLDGGQGYNLCFASEITDMSNKNFIFACANGGYPVWCLQDRK